MPLVYMNSWASLALRAVALAAFGIALLAAGSAGSPRIVLGAFAPVVLASAAHPWSVAARYSGLARPARRVALAEGVAALVLAALLAIAAAAPPGAGAYPARLAVGAALGLAGLAAIGAAVQRAFLRSAQGGRWPLLPVVIATGSAAVALLAAGLAAAVAAGEPPPLPAAPVGALLLAAWVSHVASRLRRARRSALRARQRDWALGHAHRPTPPASPRPGQPALHPAAQWS